MIDTPDKAASAGGTRRLADAVRQAKIAAAHHSDVVVEMREADRARLEILLDLVQPVIDEIPPSDDIFDFALSGGPQPRLWIDGTAHVALARDRRTYRLSRETRLGRQALAESSDPHVIAARVTDYVAERIVERDKAFAAADGISERVRVAARAGASRPPSGASEPEPEPEPPRQSRRGLGEAVLAASWLMVGVVIGAGTLLALTYFRGFTLN